MDESPTRAARGLAAVAFGVLALVVVCSVTRPLFYWDAWAYHLPFSALLLDLGGSRANFILAPELAVRYAGFPMAAELIQAALWKVSGTINTTTLVNSVSLAAFVLTCGRALRASLPVLVFGTLAVPMVALHSISSYVDLFVGSALGFQVLAAVRLHALARRRERPRWAGWCAVYVVSAALAGNAKVTGPVISASITVFLLAVLFYGRSTFLSKPVKTIVAVVAVAALASGATASKNLYEFGNPLYPFDTTIAGVHLTGPEGEYRNYPDYSAGLGPLARPVNWALSISEIDWWVRGVEPKYTLDSATGDFPQRYGTARTGGYGGALIVASLALAGWLAVRARRRDPVAFRERRFLLALFGFVTLVTACMPQSHELRYYLHWPLLLMVVVAALVRSASLSPRTQAAIACAYLAAFLAYQYELDFPIRPVPVTTQQEQVDVQTGGGPTVEAVRARGAVCLGPEYQPRQFAYAAVFHGGGYIVEQGWNRCARYPPFAASKPPPP